MQNAAPGVLGGMCCSDHVLPLLLYFSFIVALGLQYKVLMITLKAPNGLCQNVFIPAFFFFKLPIWVHLRGRPCFCSTAL